MAIASLIEMVLSIVVAVIPTILAAMKARNDVRKSAFDLGLSELHAADDRMRMEDHEYQSSPVQPS